MYIILDNQIVNNNLYDLTLNPEVLNKHLSFFVIDIKSDKLKKMMCRECHSKKFSNFIRLLSYLFSNQ